MSDVRTNDTLHGTAGNDTFNPGIGFDLVYGYEGNDLLILNYSVGDTGTGMEMSVFSTSDGAEGLARRFTSDFSATLDRIDFDGIDRFHITGTSKNDNISGYTGNDTLIGGAGNDFIRNGAGGNDSLDGSAGLDTASLDLFNQTGNISILNPSTGINLPGLVTSSNFESFHITTGSGNDNLSQAGVINGVVHRGNDLFNGNNGNDSFNAGLGFDEVNGGDDNDLLILNYSVGDTGTGMEMSVFSTSDGAEGLARRFTSDFSATLDRIDFDGIDRFHITGTSKNDSISGYLGNDTLIGGAGNDFIRNGAGGNDSLDGSAGLDTASLDLFNQTGNISILNPSTGINLPGLVTSSNFESFHITTGSGNDNLSQAGVINGVVHRGNDLFNGNNGNDSFNAGLGFDEVNGGEDNDLLILNYSVGDTGTGMEMSVFSTSDGAEGLARRFTSDFSATLDRIDFDGIDRFHITGTSKNDNISGYTGNDTLIGGAGNDFIRNGAGGNDSLDGSVGLDTASLDLFNQTGNISIINPSTGINLPGLVTSSNFESFHITTGSGNDNLSQAGVINGVVHRGNDLFNGNNGNDSFNAGLGFDEVNGGDDNDLLILNYSVGDTGTGMEMSVFSTSDGAEGLARRFTSDFSATLDRIDFDGIDRFHITGTSKNDNISGYTGNDTLIGGAGNDFIRNGAGGNDSLDGSAGLDTASLDLFNQTGNISILNPSTGINLPGLVTSSNFESFHITTGSGNDNLSQAGVINGVVHRGNDLFNGNNGNDSFNAGLGFDEVNGGEDNDLLILNYSVGDTGTGMEMSVFSTSDGAEGLARRFTSDFSATLDRIDFDGIDRFHITGTSKNDSISGYLGNDTLNGGAGNDTLIGGAGNDTINGGAGNDSMVGGEGSDRYFVDSLTDVIVEAAGGGIDTVISTVNRTLTAELENLFLGGTLTINGIGNALANVIAGNAANNNLNGVAGNDTLIGGAGNDTLIGGLGNDSMVGGVGNDLYNVDSAADIVVEAVGGGIDTVVSTVSRTLGAEQENLNLAGAANISGFGNTLANRIIGNAANNNLAGGTANDTLIGNGGNDTLTGGTGNDSLVGGIGSDRYYIDSAADVVVEAVNGGVDTVISTISYTLGAEVENLFLGGSTTLNGTGNTLANVIAGNSGNNSLNGAAGNDNLIGGAGNDTLIGGAGADRFSYNTGSAFTTTAIGVDTITDFLKGTDKILLDKTTFTALTSAAGGALSNSDFATINAATNGAAIAGASAARIVFNTFNGELFYNANGAIAGLGTGGLFVKLSGLNSLSGSDFIVQA